MRIRGVEIALHEDEALSNHIRREGDFFEAEILDHLAGCCPTHRTILDIGANIGNHALYFANFLTYETIICLEPIPANFNLLKENMERYKGVELYNLAASDGEQEVIMLEYKPNMGASKVNPIIGELVAPAITIDQLLLSRVTLMKIDVEGYEPKVLAGARGTIMRCRPLILIEDWYNEYDDLLEQMDYTLIEGWKNHKTYLWGPK